MLLPETAEHYGLEGVHSRYGGEAGYVFGMVGIAHKARNGPQEAEHQRKKSQGHAPDHKERSGIDLLLVLTLFGGKTEKGGLHTESQKGEKEGGIGVKIGHHPVTAASGRYLIGIDRDQQIVQEPAYDAAEPVQGRIFYKRTEFHCSRFKTLSA